MKPIIRLSIFAIGFSALIPIACSAALEPRADLTGSKGETVFFLLGMLDEYSGRRFIEDSDMVESFYCGEHVVAFVFRAYLSRLAQEQGLDRTIQVRWRQDCLVCFLSPEVSAFLNQFYSYSFDSGGKVRVLTEDGPKRVASASLATSQIKRTENALKTAYLAGAHFRYGQGDHFEFADSCDKMTLVADVLRDVGCDSVRVTRDRTFFTACTSTRPTNFVGPSNACRGSGGSSLPTPWSASQRPRISRSTGRLSGPLRWVASVATRFRNPSSCAALLSYHRGDVAPFPGLRKDSVKRSKITIVPARLSEACAISRVIQCV
jgi:hypothetical protein